MDEWFDKVPEIATGVAATVSALIMDFKNADSKGKAVRIAALFIGAIVLLSLLQAVFG